MPTLIVQMGHCYRTFGATGTAGEQPFATSVANACIALLNGRGGWVVRKILADESGGAYRGDAFVAVHCDGSTSSAARGASVGYRTPEGQALGQAWKRAYAARGWPGFRPDNYTAALANYYGTGTAVSVGNRRAVIIECGFLTNPDDRALLISAGGAQRVALAIGDAVGIPHNQPPQEDDMVDWNARYTFGRLGITTEFGNWVGETNAAANAAARDAAVVRTQLAALNQTLSDDEANVLAALQRVAEAVAAQDQIVTPEQLEHLAAAIAVALPEELVDEFDEKLRAAFTRAGQETTP